MVNTLWSNAVLPQLILVLALENPVGANQHPLQSDSSASRFA